MMNDFEETDLELPEPVSLPLTEEVLKLWMKHFIQYALGLENESFSTDDRFDSYGLDSVEAVVMAGIMEEEFSIAIDPALLFRYPSIDSFAAANSHNDSHSL